MLLSVLVPVYNVETYIERCIESLLSQTYKDCEIILVDDGSTDKSGDICDLYAKSDTRIRVIHKTNGGLASARCAGLMASKGQYVAFVDSDDYLDDYMFTQLMKPMLEDDGVDISIGGYVINRVDGSIVNVLSDKKKKIYYDNIEALADMFEVKKFNWGLWGKVYRRELFIHNDLMAKWPSSYGEDAYANSYVFPLAKKMVFNPVYGYHYCMRKDSMMHAQFCVDKLDFLDIIYALTEKYNGSLIRLFNALSHLLISLSVTYLKDMLDEYSKYILYIDKYQKKLLMWFDRLTLDVQQEYALKTVLKKPSEYVIWKLEWERKIKLFCDSSARGVYIYGTGVYGQATLELLELWGVRIAGFIESNPVAAEYKNYPIRKVDDIANGLCVIVAMDYKNTLSVSEFIREKKLNVLYIWRYFLII